MDSHQLTSIFKSEYSNLIAVLCNYYELTDLQLAEDIVSDTFVVAMKSWSHNGIPDSPKAWLRKVAQNKLFDHFRRTRTFQEKVIPHFDTRNEISDTIELTNEIIEDSQLKMIFIVCDPGLNTEAQLSIALRILCGFSIESIAKALLSNKDAINKKLYRAKKIFKEKDRLKTNISREQYVNRLDIVLRVIYLLFNEGYYSSANEQNIRHEICWEAMRLCIFLKDQRIFPKPKIHALLALMCFHASRLDARANGETGDLLYDDQDKGIWDLELISKGKEYLNLSAKGNTVSKYHLEAAIAYWHTVNTDDKWNNILQLYDQLLSIEYSPIIALNRIYVLARTNAIQDAIHEAHALDITHHHYHYCLLAELYHLNDNFDKEIYYLTKAQNHAIKKNQQKLILDKLKLARQSQME